MEAFRSLSFEVLYMLESALSFNYIVEYDLTSEVADFLRQLEPLKASMILEHIVSSRRRVWNLKQYLVAEAAKLARVSTRPRIVPPQCVYLRKVIVTPTTIHMQPPTIETSNRIIRNFSQLSDYFLRVEFSDEGNNRVWSRDSTSNENNAIYNRIFSALTNGIRIGNREYQFLAFSASQLRDNAAWFFCSQGGSHTVNSIHRWMGNFSHIKSIAKYAARMGQCFSSTRAIATLTASEVEMIGDIERDRHNFSDGCGRISLALAKLIGIEMEKETTPVAFQIRLGGSKGVLVWYPPLREKRVQIRPSMKKFNVAYYVLEVIKTSSFISSYLNRQIIILLTALGVPDSVIWTLKNNMVRDLERIESDGMIAIKTLYQNWDENGTSKMMVSMIRAGFLQAEDPFIKNLLTLFKWQMLEELSKKARIFVPKGAYLLGVCDETGELQEGEIFVQVSSVENPTKHTIIEGKCAVVRCPCFHPGDIRVVQAVNRPGLRHLYDVVVFNTKGARGIPSMCSGGDLDGDGNVIWDPDIVNNIREFPPMDYTSRDPVTSSDVTIHDIKKFFVQYAVSNNLGVIANAHLALSDRLEEGPHHGKCIRLAQLHSDAVDFPKTGKPAEITSELRPRSYPDFMEKPPERSYRSGRLLGRIYRDCNKQQAFTPKNYRQSFNRLLLIDGYESYMNDAKRCKALYDDEVLSLMNQYGVKRYGFSARIHLSLPLYTLGRSRFLLKFYFLRS
ncbi:RNA dependent RNA polymerase-domain-containing protein [Gamsiella multidivaricata]|uniref:RNA dependent RNA polymerase-domain-containing protein n=1 Tax=Gamsiella multidivaricata TaxID=101098 RepID=UPI00221ECAD1|nr:RNA dependent RNA polymerase-domain-containing protein [Gamsiella multidivaricata]KAI7818038.1 RNA dependent RNA polymerase-domain-containing protein [Gamsiella multidivaricata]